MTLEISLIFGLILVVILVPGVPQPLTGREPVPARAGMGWEVGHYDGNYWVLIYNIEPIESHEVGYKVLTPNKLVSTIDDPSRQEVRIEGDLDDIEFNLTKYNEALSSSWVNATQGSIFFADYPEGQYNDTLFTVFMDNDDDDNLSPGDIVWLRGKGNGGPAGPGSIFRLINQRHGSPYGDLILPEKRPSTERMPGERNQRMRTTSLVDPVAGAMASILSMFLFGGLSFVAIALLTLYYNDPENKGAKRCSPGPVESIIAIILVLVVIWILYPTLAHGMKDNGVPTTISVMFTTLLLMYVSALVYKR